MKQTDDRKAAAREVAQKVERLAARCDRATDAGTNVAAAGEALRAERRLTQEKLNRTATV